MMHLRPYQQDAIDAAYRHLRERDDNPVVVIPTAGGKTPILATICLLSSSVTVVLAEHAFRRGQTGGFRLWWLITILLAVAFLGWALRRRQPRSSSSCSFSYSMPSDAMFTGTRNGCGCFRLSSSSGSDGSG